MLQYLYPQKGETVDTLTPLQKGFIEKIRAEGIDEALRWLKPLKTEQEQTHPQGCRLAWVDDQASACYKVELAESADFQNCRTYHTADRQITVTNLKIGQTYFWRVNGGEASHFFTRNDGYRFIEVDGLPNLRDLGGGKIRQGLLYRGSELDWEYKITERGKETFAKELGIKTQLNLRKEMQSDRTLSVVGHGVAFRCLPYRPYDEVFQAEQRENIRRIFEFLAEASHYPIYFHCRGGADRTGMLAFYLRALAGESEETVLIDYELTSLSNYNGGAAEGDPSEFRRRNSDYFSLFYKTLQEVTGQTALFDMVYVFLLDCGVSEQTLRQVIQILK